MAPQAECMQSMPETRVQTPVPPGALSTAKSDLPPPAQSWEQPLNITGAIRTKIHTKERTPTLNQNVL